MTILLYVLCGVAGLVGGFLIGVYVFARMMFRNIWW